jgi:hypothetical protein
MNTRGNVTVQSWESLENWNTSCERIAVLRSCGAAVLQLKNKAEGEVEGRLRSRFRLRKKSR